MDCSCRRSSSFFSLFLQTTINLESGALKIHRASSYDYMDAALRGSAGLVTSTLATIRYTLFRREPWYSSSILHNASLANHFFQNICRRREIRMPYCLSLSSNLSPAMSRTVVSPFVFDDVPIDPCPLVAPFVLDRLISKKEVENDER